MAKETTKKVKVSLPDGGVLTVSDPCYLIDHYADEETLTYDDTSDASVNNAALHPGEWEAYAVQSEAGDWGMRVWRAGLRLLDPPAADAFEDYGQGVDAGMVGFFVNRPRLAYSDTWSADGGVTSDGMGLARLLTRGESFAWVTDSGFGDGYYKITLALSSGKVIAVEADYWGDNDDEVE